MARPGASWGHGNPGRSSVSSCGPRPGLWDSPLGVRPQGGRAPQGLLPGFLSRGLLLGAQQEGPERVSNSPPPYSLKALLGCLGVKISRIRGSSPTKQVRWAAGDSGHHGCSPHSAESPGAPTPLRGHCAKEESTPEAAWEDRGRVSHPANPTRGGLAALDGGTRLPSDPWKNVQVQIPAGPWQALAAGLWGGWQDSDQGPVFPRVPFMAQDCPPTRLLSSLHQENSPEAPAEMASESPVPPLARTASSDTSEEVRPASWAGGGGTGWQQVRSQVSLAPGTPACRGGHTLSHVLFS